MLKWIAKKILHVELNKLDIENYELRMSASRLEKNLAVSENANTFMRQELSGTQKEVAALKAELETAERTQAGRREEIVRLVAELNQERQRYQIKSRIPRSVFDHFCTGLTPMVVTSATTDLQAASWAGINSILRRMEAELVDERG